MKLIKNEEEAVSPVIGVILMVAIVVILAAVIAAFVFGMAGSSGTSKNVATTVTFTAGEDPGSYTAFEILWQGGTDINRVNGAGYTISGSANTTPSAITLTNPPPEVGEITNQTATFSSGDRLIITATFDDGT